MIDQRVPDKVYVTETEFTQLTRHAVDGNHLNARFGVNGVWLVETASNNWAFKLLAEWRGVNVAYDY